MAILTTEDLEKIYESGENEVHALDGVTFQHTELRSAIIRRPFTARIMYAVSLNISDMMITILTAT